MRCSVYSGDVKYCIIGSHPELGVGRLVFHDAHHEEAYLDLMELLIDGGSAKLVDFPLSNIHKQEVMLLEKFSINVMNHMLMEKTPNVFKLIKSLQKKSDGGV